MEKVKEEKKKIASNDNVFITVLMKIAIFITLFNGCLFYGLNKTCAMHILVSLRAKDKQETATKLPSLNVSVTGLIHS